MKLSVALIGTGFILLAVPRLNKPVEVFFNNIPYINRIRAPASTIIAGIGFLGLLMNWF